MSNTRRQLVLTILATVVVALAAAAAAVASSSGGAAAAERSIVIGARDVSRSLDPDSIYIPDVTARKNLYDRLLQLGTKANPASLGGGVMIDPDPKKFAPKMATSWKVSNNGTVWTFNLRRGIKSAFGNELTAEDVKWSLDRAMTLNSVGGRGLRLVSRVLSVEAPSRYVVRVTTQGQSPVFVLRLSFQAYTPIIDSTEAKKHATGSDPWAVNWLVEHSAGFGPYELTSWTKGQSMIFTARKDYWGPKPYYDKVTVLAMPDPGARLSALKQGSIQMALDLGPDLIRDARKESGLKVVEFNGNNQLVLYPNLNVPQLADRRVRQAIARAIPYEDIIKGVYFGTASIMKSPLPPYLTYATERYWRYATNIEEAKRLLAAAGYANGFEISLTYANEHPELDPIVAAIQQALAKIGIKVNAEKGPESVLVSRAIGPHNIPFYISNTGSPEAPDGSTVTGFFIRGAAGNVTNYFNPAMERLHGGVLNTLTLAKRTQLFYQAQKIMETDLPYIWLLTFHETIAMKKQIQDYTWSPDHATVFSPLKES